MLDLFQHPIIKVATMLTRFVCRRACRVGCRNKFGMTVFYSFGLSD
jgi:hypothetical protein